MSGFSYAKDENGIVTITMDLDGPVNAMGRQYRREMAAAIEKLEKDTGLRGVVIASAKSTFFAGADLKEMDANGAKTPEQQFHEVGEIKDQFRRLEKLQVPVVAAINGAALGGGYELSLACNYRLLLNVPSAVVGLPEVGLGLLPGGGGIVRLVSRLGFQAALPHLLEGKRYRPEQALENKLVDELVDSAEQLIPRAKAWIKANTTHWAQPWDKKGFAVPGGSATAPAMAQITTSLPAITYQKTRGLLPAPERILDVAVQASYLDFAAAQKIETRALIYLMGTPQAKNIINTTFFQLNQVNAGASRPQSVEPQKVRKLGILGAGMMGQGIAYVSAMAGIPVVLKDVTQALADQGKQYSATLLAKSLQKGQLSEDQVRSTLSLIKPTTDVNDLAGCDLIIEAVFEDIELKAKVTREAEPMLAEGGVFASNTSALPIASLATAARDPRNFVGAHFFSPVDKMPLVELVCGKQTGDHALAKVFDFARQIKKTPIVVNDSLGFYTTRTIGTYLDEAAKLLTSGIHPVRIERLAKAIGMPVGPLALQDEIGLRLMAHAAKSNAKHGLTNDLYDIETSTSLAVQMVNDLNRPGRRDGGGFYEYPEAGAKHIWPGLVDMFHDESVDVSDHDIQDRLLFRPVIESLHCLETHVLKSVADANVGSLLGIGAPEWTGGYIQFVNTYGLRPFIRRCDELRSRYGDRFAAPAVVKQKAEVGACLE